MKCSRCLVALRKNGFVVTLVSSTERVYTAVLHLECLDELVGHAGRRRLDRLCIDAGWQQAELPGFGLAEASV